MCLIGSDDLLPLSIHAVDIVFISVVQLIHFPDEVIPFISQSTKIIFEPSLLGLGILSPISHLLQLVVKISETMAVAFMLSFKFSQFVILSE